MDVGHAGGEAVSVIGDCNSNSLSTRARWRFGSLIEESAASMGCRRTVAQLFGAKSNDGASVGQYTLPDGFKVKEQKYTTFKSSTGRYHATDAKAPKDRLPNKDPQKAVVVSHIHILGGECVDRPMLLKDKRERPRTAPAHGFFQESLPRPPPDFLSDG